MTCCISRLTNDSRKSLEEISTVRNTTTSAIKNNLLCGGQTTDSINGCCGLETVIRQPMLPHMMMHTNGTVYETADFYPPQASLMARTLTTTVYDDDMHTATADVLNYVLNQHKNGTGYDPQATNSNSTQHMIINEEPSQMQFQSNYTCGVGGTVSNDEKEDYQFLSVTHDQQ